MKNKTDTKKHGAGMSKVPFYCESIISCLDLTRQTIKNLSGFPEIVKHDSMLQGQLCYDLAHAMRDRLEENHNELNMILDAEERRLWESISPIVSSAYKNLGTHLKNDQNAFINEEKARGYCTRFTPNSVLSQDREFQSLLKSVIPSMKLETNENLAQLVGKKATDVRDETVQRLSIARDKLTKEKDREKPANRLKVYGEICRLAIDHHDTLFEFSMNNMCRLSDTTQRLVNLKDCGWITNFWTKVESLTRSSTGFSIESFAMRRLGSAQYMLNQELNKDDKKTIAKRPDIFREWVLKHGCRWGIPLKKTNYNTQHNKSNYNTQYNKFNYNALYNKFKKQDERVDSFFLNLGLGNARDYLKADKKIPYLKLESQLASNLVKTENDYSVLAHIVRSTTTPKASKPKVINLCPDIGQMLSQKEGGSILNLENTIGSTIESKDHLIRKITRLMNITIK